ncbi:RsmB/NOP family class I SAM-dependent RNA methyltransferase [Tomitella fengzijianii]|uniref:rRNA small subunit methyltransferase B n=1 Tax=Tomitella fengzijianii TaxID=2597660 RepID=A0A516X300_9ACTN|nr:transcription antitermination factor NusB [Tomitella fengzijianii]QDQ97452.1 rRNA small subunit methyltransferase B [Tomitella fengzijianii]
MSPRANGADGHPHGGGGRQDRGRSGDGGNGRPRAEKGRSRAGRGPAGRDGREARRREHPAADPAREAARDTLRAVRERDAYANLVLPRLLRERRISGRDAAFATELTYGACRALGLLDAVIEACAGRALDRIDPPVLDALRLGVYQLLRTRVAPHAAVSTTVDMVVADNGRGAGGFANAVLRRASEKTDQQWIAQLTPPPESAPVAASAFRHTHPTWIAQAFADALGPAAGELDAALEADNVSPRVHLVARPGAISAEELALVTGGEEGRYSPYAVYLDGGDPGELDPVREGLAAVQDEGSQLVARAVTVAPLDGPDGGRWLDLCAGPGGKAALMGAVAEIDGARVDAVEPLEHRADLVRRTTGDLPVTVHTADGRDSGLTPGYDRILVDAPCTGLGALRRRPEARWRKGPQDVTDLTRLQRELLGAAAALVRPGGVIVYATCSPHLAETAGIAADAQRRHGLTPLDARTLLPDMPGLGDGPFVQLWPHRHGTDGMFLAALRK